MRLQVFFILQYHVMYVSLAWNNLLKNNVMFLIIENPGWIINACLHYSS